MGPLLFCLSTHCHCTSLRSAFCELHFDDVTKSKIICEDVTIKDAILCSLPSGQVIHPEKGVLRGSPLGDVATTDAFLGKKTKALHLMGACF